MIAGPALILADCIAGEAFLAPRSFFAALPMGWEITRARMIRWGEPWELEEVICDLRWWEDRIRMKQALKAEDRPRKVMPSERELARWWGWSKQKARRILNARHTWADPAHQNNPAPRRRARADPKPSICAGFGAPLGHCWGTVGAEQTQSPYIESQQCAGFGAPLGHSRGTRGAVVGHHTRANSQDTTSQEHKTQEKKEGAEVGQVTIQPTSAPSFSRLTWTVNQVKQVWRDAWRAADRGGRPCRGRQDGTNAEELAAALMGTQTSREAFLTACVGYLTAQACGDAFPKDGVPLLGHAKRVWRDYLPGSRQRPGVLPRSAPWDVPYTSSPAPIWSSACAHQWLERNRSEVEILRVAIAERGGGDAELLQWLTPRVASPDDVLAAMREVA